MLINSKKKENKMFIKYKNFNIRIIDLIKLFIKKKLIM